MKSLTYLIGVVSGLLLASAQAQSGSELNEIPLLDNQSLSQYEKTFHPPLPDIWVDGVLMSWEEVYGPIVILPPPVADNMSRSASSSALLRTQQVAESAPFTRHFADPQTRATLLSSNSPTRIDFVRLAELTAIHQEKDPSSFEDLEITLIRSEDANTNLCVGIKGSVTNQFALDYTCYKLSIANIPTDEEVDVFFSEKASLGEWLTTSLACVGTNDSTGTKIYVATVKGHHSGGFFIAALVCDTDDDGLSDAVEELIFKSNPDNSDSNFLRDGNGNGSPDFPGKANNWVCDGDEDLDGDGWSNADEIAMGTDPFVAQNNGLDVDDDGLPDWAEQNLFIWRGVQNQNAFVDSDGDGVENYTELALGTNISMDDAVYNRILFDSLPDSQRAFEFSPLVIARGIPPSGEVISNMTLECVGLLGSYLHLQIHRDKVIQNGSLISFAGNDTILFNGAYLTPQSFNSISTIRTSGMTSEELSNGLLSTRALLGGYVQILNGVWSYEAATYGTMESRTMYEAYTIAQRSMARTVILMKKVQLSLDLINNFSDQPPETQQKVYRLVGKICEESKLYHRASQRYLFLSQNIPIDRIGYCLQFGSAICMVLNAVDAALTIDHASDLYVRDVARRADDYADTAGDLAVAIQNFIGSMTNGTVYIGNIWVFFWDLLSDFDGYDCTS